MCCKVEGARLVGRTAKETERGVKEGGREVKEKEKGELRRKEDELRRECANLGSHGGAFEVGGRETGGRRSREEKKRVKAEGRTAEEAEREFRREKGELKSKAGVVKE